MDGAAGEDGDFPENTGFGVVGGPYSSADAAGKRRQAKISWLFKQSLYPNAQ